MIKNERFWSRVDVVAADACWNWLGSFDTRGYGHLNVDGKTQRAHRIAYTLANGDIPPGVGWHGTVIMHACDNKKCCNPSHLLMGDHKANMADVRVKGLRKNINTGSRNGRAKLTSEQVQAIRNDTRGKRTIAPEYGISPAQVQRVRLGLQWK